jgi:hypothetical protein
MCLHLDLLNGDTVVLMAVGAGLNEVASSELADMSKLANRAGLESLLD